MDMGISVIGDLNERRRCYENIKVYTRRSRIRNLKNKTTSDTKVIAEDKNDEKSKDDHGDESNNTNIDIVSDQSVLTSATQNLNSVQEKGNCTVPDETLEIVDIENLDLVEEDNETVLDQSLQIKPAKDLNLVQELESGPSKPIITKIDGHVRISLAPARPRNEVRELKRKLEDELDQVRGLVQRLQAKKIQLTNYSVSNGGYDDSHIRLHSQAKDVITQVRLNSSMVGSVSHYDSKPFQNLSVQVFESNHNGIEFCEKEKRTPKENQYYRRSEFLLANDRLPPENNKNLKTNGARKYVGENLRSCNNLLSRLMRHKFAWVFNKPVDAKALGLHDYHYIIRNPMDLGTIKSKLAKNRYKSLGDFAEDVRLTFRNAMTYNPMGHDVYVMAEELWYIFEDKWVAIESKINYDWRYGLVQEMSLHSPLSRKVHPSPPSLSRPPAIDMEVLERPALTTTPIDYRPKPKAPVVRKRVPKKPKSKDPDKRDMTCDEKQKLSTQLQDLPSDKLEAIVQIVNRGNGSGNGSLSHHDDEIELDIDSLDTETLWELDRLVMNYKKNLSKRKRRAEIAQARAEARPAVSAMNDESTITQAFKAPMKDQNNGAKFPLPGEGIGESSSSSSSSSDSDSDSDSSDSDSDSSSGYRSAAGHSPKT